jgi:ligand-binding sensor domain-containing protein
MHWLPLFLFVATTAWAQPPRYFTHFTEKDGLSDNNVQCLLRDQAGYLWVGTSNGLNRWDGYHFRQYLPDLRQPGRAISNEIIYDIEQDRAGNIWIATANGLNRYDPRTETFKVWKKSGSDANVLPSPVIWDLSIGPNDQIWLACDNRELCRFDPKTEQFQIYPWRPALVQELPSAARSVYKSILSFRPQSDKGLWVITNLGVLGFDFATSQFDYHPKSTAWLPSTDGLRNDVFPMGNTYWVLGNNGLSIAQPATQQMTAVVPAIGNRYSAPTGRLVCHFKEPNGMLWIGGEKGLFQYDPAAQHFAYTPLKTDLGEGVAYSFGRIVDSKVDGRRYICDLDAGQLLIYEHGQKLASVSRPGNCGLLAEDKEGRLWVGFGKKIYWLDRFSLTLRPFPVPAAMFKPTIDSHFSSMAQDAAGNLWFGNNDEGVLVWSPDKAAWWKPGEQDGFIAGSINEIMADVERRTIWFATDDYGLYKFDERDRTFTLYQPDEDNPTHSFAAYLARDLCKDGLGRIWIATDPGGISRFDYDAPEGQQFITLNTNKGLPSNQVNSIETDRNGNVWAGTMKGLANVDVISLQVRGFDKNDGMTDDMLDRTMALATTGEVLCGIAQGYQSFHPDSLRKGRGASGVLLTAFRIFDKDYADSLSINYLQNIDLAWHQNFFSFEFAATDFSQPAKNEYAYRLTGYDNDWNYAQKRHAASYTGVPPGHYLLEIKSGRDGDWQPPGIRLSIHIAAPFWATWWFYALCTAIVVASVVAFYRWRIAQLRKEEALKAEFNQRLVKMEMVALRAQMNPHFVFNCLSSINRFILVNQPEEASAYLTKFSRLIRLILDNSRSETVTLDKELHALQLYVEMEQLRFNNRFDFVLQVDQSVEAEHTEIPPLLIQPYVENAIWHGLMHKKGDGLLQVSVYYDADQKFHIDIEDNGVGRQRAMELKSRSAITNKSYGMKVTAERLETINQLYGTNTSVSTVDLMDEKKQPVGTKVLIYFDRQKI